MRPLILLALILSTVLHAQVTLPLRRNLSYMRLRFLILFFTLVSVPALSQTTDTAVPPRLEKQWHKAAQLKPGTPLLLREMGAMTGIRCQLEWIDATSVACSGKTGAAATIYPAASLASIKRDLAHFRWPHRLTGEEIVCAIFGGLFGTALGIIGGPALMSLGAIGGAFLGVSFADTMHDVFTSSP